MIQKLNQCIHWSAVNKKILLNITCVPIILWINKAKYLQTDLMEKLN